MLRLSKKSWFLSALLFFSGAQLYAQGPDTLWSKTYGGDTIDIGYSVQMTSDGGYIITGSTRSFGSGEEDVYLIKTAANGNPVWLKSYGGAGSDIGWAVGCVPIFVEIHNNTTLTAIL